MTAPLRAATYARVSTTDQATDGTSLDTQEQQTASHIKAKGWVHVGHFVDEGVSGAKDKRPGLDRLMAACRDGGVDVVVVSKLDRFSRSMLHLVNAMAELDDLGVAFVSVSESIDSTTKYGKMQMSMVGTFAEFERERIVERMMEGHRSVVRDGYWRGGPAPFGYKLLKDEMTKHTRVVVNDEEVEVLKRTADLIVNHGYNTYTATVLLNAEGITTRSKGKWRHSNLRWHLRQEHLTGRWGYSHQGEWVPMTIPAIFTNEEWDAIQHSINGGPRPQRKSRVYALTGRGRCHLRCNCGGNYGGKHDHAKGLSWYVCGRNAQEFGTERCPHTPRHFRASELDSAVIAALRPAFDEEYLLTLAETYLSQHHGQPDQVDRRRDLTRKLTSLKAEKTAIVRRMAQGGELDYLDDAIAEIEVEEAALHDQLREIERREHLRVERDSLEQQLHDLAEGARTKLDSLTETEMAELFDLLELDLERVGARRFEGTASIPIPPDGGEVWAGSRRHRGPRQESLDQGGVEGPT